MSIVPFTEEAAPPDDESVAAYLKWAYDKWISFGEKWAETRVMVNKFMQISIYAHYYKMYMLATSVFSLLLYITRTYLEPRGNRDVVVVYDGFELYLGVIFAFDWSLNYFLAEHKRVYMWSFYALVDMCTVLATFSTWGRIRPEQNSINSLESLLLYILFGLKTVRILRSLQIHSLIEDLVQDSVDRFIGVMSLTMSIFILFCK